MLATRQPPVQLNVRVSPEKRRQLDIFVAQHGITRQKAIEDAIDLMVERASRALRPISETFPIIKSRGGEKINPTKEQLSEAFFGGYKLPTRSR